MKAAQFFGKRDIRVVNIPEPIPKPNEALVSVEWAGICGSDLHEYVHGAMAIPRPEHPHVLTGSILPITMGHEFCGKVSQVRKDSNLNIGDAVMVDPRLFCSSCDLCIQKSTNACDKWGFLGLSGGGGGGFSETVAVDTKMLYPIPEDILEYAALIEPLAVAWHALKISKLKSFHGKNVLVVGGGPVGIALTFVLKNWGAGRVFVSEPTAARKVWNKEFADEVFDPLKEKVGDLSRFLTNGKGVDVVFDAAGTPLGLLDGIDALKHGGIYVNVAAWEKPFTVPFIPFMMKEETLISSRAYDDNDFRETVAEFVKGSFKGVEKMVTSRISLDDIVEKGFENLVDRKDEHVKILVTLKGR